MLIYFYELLKKMYLFILKELQREVFYHCSDGCNCQAAPGRSHELLLGLPHDWRLGHHPPLSQVALLEAEQLEYELASWNAGA